MDNLLSFWQANGMEILLALLLLLVVLLGNALKQQQHQARAQSDAALALQAQLEGLDMMFRDARKELTDGSIQSQLSLHGAIHKSAADLFEKQGQRQTELEKRLQMDAGELKLQLTESQARLERRTLEDSAALKETLGSAFAQLERRLLEDSTQLREALTQGFETLQANVVQQLAKDQLTQQEGLGALRSQVDAALGQQRESFEKRQVEALNTQQQALHLGMEMMSRQLSGALKDFSDESSKRLHKLTETTDQRLREISSEVEKRLAKGFEKTTETFTRVLEHLSRIDEAQKKITELSGNVVSLQEVLADKRSRGAFGEVQLAALVRNMLPEDQFVMQAQLSNKSRVDCLLKLPQPTGDVPIDAKFPLESYQKMMDRDASKGEREQAARTFRNDIKKHIKDIASKYLIPGETADGAIMFLPAEAVFAEIHAHFPELVEEAQKARVWIVSPTTMMAVLTTARAVIKDIATRKQVHIIQEHLAYLSKDFVRFQERMDALAKHIRLAHEDVERVNTSARKISSRFERIEKVELDDDDLLLDDKPLLVESTRDQGQTS